MTERVKNDIAEASIAVICNNEAKRKAIRHSYIGIVPAVLSGVLAYRFAVLAAEALESENYLAATGLALATLAGTAVAAAWFYFPIKAYKHHRAEKQAENYLRIRVPYSELSEEDISDLV